MDDCIKVFRGIEVTFSVQHAYVSVVFDVFQKYMDVRKIQVG